MYGLPVSRRGMFGPALFVSLTGLAAWACSSGTESDDPGTSGASGSVAAGSGGASAAAGRPGTAGGGGVAGGAGAQVSGASGVADSGGLSGANNTAGQGGMSASAGTAGESGSSNAGRAGAGSSGAAGVGNGPVLFSKNVRLNDDTGSGVQHEVALAAGPRGLVISGWMDERSERVCAFSVSTDGGLTWGKNVSIAKTSGGFVGDPSVSIDAGGTLYAVCMDYGINQIKMMTSTDSGATWSAPRQIQSAPDKPWVGGGTSDGTVFVSWLGSSAGIKRSLDHGLTWGSTQALGNIIHGTAIVTSTSGLVHVPYNLDSDRNQLRYLRSKDGGATYDTPRDLVADMGTFCFECTPRQHPIVGAASDPSGKTVAITWSSKMPGGQGDDDIWLIYSKDGGDTWTKPIRVNDNSTPSRQFQPWVAVDSHARVHVAWTDLRDNGQNETWYARSSDPSKGFEANLQVSDAHGSAALDFLGDYKGIVVQGSDVLVVWEDTRRGNGDIYFSRAAGAAGP